jgi:glycosyltransferase involved in cell wall biosynthesis
MGYLERIYSSFPWFRLAQEGVSRGKVSTFPLIKPVLMADRYMPFPVPEAVMDRLHQVSNVAFDRYVSCVMPRADIFVGHEAVGLISGTRARQRGSAYVCDRGCTHMAWRERVLQEERDRFGIGKKRRPATYDREIEEYDRADLIVVPSGIARRSFIESGIAPDKVAVVPYGVSLERFHPVTRPDPGRFDVLFAGGLSARKGAFDLLESFRMAAIPGSHLTIAGTIDPEIESRHGDLLARPNITRAGHVPHDQLKDLMSRSHVLVLPSIEDGFGMVVSEAMACGCPAVVSENAGAADIVREGENGFVVPIRSPETIAARLTDLAHDPRRREKMGIAALETVRTLGGWETYGRQMVVKYRRLLDARV